MTQVVFFHSSNYRSWKAFFKNTGNYLTVIEETHFRRKIAFSYSKCFQRFRIKKETKKSKKFSTSLWKKSSKIFPNTERRTTQIISLNTQFVRKLRRRRWSFRLGIYLFFRATGIVDLIVTHTRYTSSNNSSFIERWSDIRTRILFKFQLKIAQKLSSFKCRFDKQTTIAT